MAHLISPYVLETPAHVVTDSGQRLVVPGEMTVEEFAAFPWPERERWELLEGTPVMSPSPIPDHQELLRELIVFLSMELPEWRVCPGIDILPGNSSSYVCPDVVVLEAVGRDERPTMRIPALVVEIVSPSTKRNDLGAKLALYERAGIGEYWIADPAEPGLTIHALAGSGPGRGYRAVAPDARGSVASPLRGSVASPLLTRAVRLYRQGERFRIDSHAL